MWLKHLNFSLKFLLSCGTVNSKFTVVLSLYFAVHIKFSQSQNHGMLGIGRDLCGSSSPTPLPKQGHLQQAAQDRIQAGLEYLQRRRIHNLWGACSSAPSPSEGRSSSSCSDGTSCASVCALCPLSCRWAPLKTVWPHPPDTHPSDIYKVPSQPSLP